MKNSSLTKAISYKDFKKEVLDGVEVTRVPLYPSHNQSVMGITCTVTLTVILLAQSIFLSATPKQSKDLFVD